MADLSEYIRILRTLSSWEKRRFLQLGGVFPMGFREAKAPARFVKCKSERPDVCRQKADGPRLAREPSQHNAVG